MESMTSHLLLYLTYISDDIEVDSFIWQPFIFHLQSCSYVFVAISWVWSGWFHATLLDYSNR